MRAHLTDSYDPRGPRLRRAARLAVRLLPALIALAVMVFLVLSMRRTMLNTIWGYFTDDISIRRDASGADVRLTLRETPHPSFAAFNVPCPALQEPAFAPDGATMVVTVSSGAADPADLALCTWDGRRWGEPAPLAAANSPFKETGASFSRDGRVLYFASDRPGGLGGFDIWACVRNAQAWGAPTNLGAAVNSPANEFGPAPDAADAGLYFASDRGEPGRGGGRGRCQIYRAGAASPPAALTGAAATNAAPAALTPLPQYRPAEPVAALKSGADDRDPEVAPRGDALYFSSNRRGGSGGFDIFAARILGGAVRPPAALGGEVNSRADELAPAVRWEGFDLMFCSNRGEADATAFRLHTATTREIVEDFDFSRLFRLIDLLRRIWLWLLLIAVAIPLLLYLIRHYRDLTSLFHKCLAASAIVHLVLLLAAASWRVTSELVQAMPSGITEISINANALAQEKMALSIQEKVVELPKTEVSSVIEQTRSVVPMPEFKPVEVKFAAPAVARSADRPFVVAAAPSVQPRTTSRIAPAKPPDKMPDLQLPEIEVAVQMPEREPPGTSGGAAAPVGPKGEDELGTFAPEVVQEQVRVDFVKPTKFAMVKPRMRVVDASAISVVTSTNAAGAERDGVAAGGPSGVGNPGIGSPGLPTQHGRGGVTLMAPIGDVTRAGGRFSGRGTSLQFDGPGRLEVPDNFGKGGSHQLYKYSGMLSDELVEGLGGSGETQGCVARSLDWFTRNQEPDGRWDIAKHGGAAGNDVSATALILLCYYGWGVRHNQAGTFQAPVQKGVDWLVARAGANGDFCTGSTKGMYNQGMGAMALCEAYGLTKDPKVGEAARKAIAFILAAQHPDTGGWRYQPRTDGDTSVFGWQYMALHSAKLAGLDVPEAALKKAEGWLDRVAGGQQGGLYGYQSAEANRPAMIATGMFCRQLGMVPPTDPRMTEGAQYLRAHPIGGRSIDPYYLYYGTLALYQHQGEAWDDWNKRLKASLPLLQHKTGDMAGSWDPGAGHGTSMGRAVTTALATLSLEVYYRLLPIYGFRPPAEK